MKVLSITPTFFPALGGLEQVVLELASRMRALGVHMDVAHVAPGLQATDESVQGIRVHRLPLYGHRALGWAPSLAALAKGYDLLHVHDPQLLAITANIRLSAGSIPAVLSTHGGFWHTSKGAQLKKFYEATFLRGAANHYRRVLASSVGDFDYFKRYASRIWLCSNGVQVKAFGTVGTRDAQNLHRWIYWGRLSRNKRVDLVIDCVAAAHGAGHPVDLLICGKDFDGILHELTAQVQRLGLESSVHFEPFMDDAALRAELARRTVYITASEHEGFGLSVVEAMAAGLIVVCRDMVPLNSFIEHRQSGWLMRFDGSDSDRARLLELLARTPADIAQLSVAARSAAAVHDWDAVAPRFLEHYRAVLGTASH